MLTYPSPLHFIDTQISCYPTHLPYILLTLKYHVTPTHLPYILLTLKYHVTPTHLPYILLTLKGDG